MTRPLLRDRRSPRRCGFANRIPRIGARVGRAIAESERSVQSKSDNYEDSLAAFLERTRGWENLLLLPTSRSWVTTTSMSWKPASWPTQGIGTGMANSYDATPNLSIAANRGNRIDWVKRPGLRRRRRRRRRVTSRCRGIDRLNGNRRVFSPLERLHLWTETKRHSQLLSAQTTSYRSESNRTPVSVVGCLRKSRRP
jgi:hypothetical protein